MISFIWSSRTGRMQPCYLGLPSSANKPSKSKKWWPRKYGRVEASGGGRGFGWWGYRDGSGVLARFFFLMWGLYACWLHHCSLNCVFTFYTLLGASVRFLNTKVLKSFAFVSVHFKQWACTLVWHMWFKKTDKTLFESHLGGSAG